MRELVATPKAVRKIIKEESVIRLGTVVEAGRGFVNANMGGSSNVRILVPDQIALSQLVAGDRILCIKPDNNSPWIATATYGQPDRYRRATSSASISTDPDWSSWGPTLTESDILLGWRDDFMGYAIDARYGQLFNAGDTGCFTLLDAIHNGAIEIRAADVANHYAYLTLGTAGTLLNVSNLSGWVMFGEWKMATIANCNALWGCRDATADSFVVIRQNSAVGTDFYLINRHAGSTLETVVLAAADTAYHKWALEVRSGIAYAWMDGVLVGETTSVLTTSNLTPSAGTTALNVAYKRLQMKNWFFSAR